MTTIISIKGEIMISINIDENKEKLIELFNNTSDLMVHEFIVGSAYRAAIGYIIGIIDKTILEENIIKPLVKNLTSPYDIRSTINSSNLLEVSNLEESITYITNGSVILFIEGTETAYIINISKWPHRQVDRPTTEMVIRGPKEAFVEDIQTNKTLLRHIIKNNNLVIEDYILGVQTNTIVSFVYIKGIVKESVLEEARKRIQKLKIDSVLSSGYIEALIGGKKNGLTATIAYTEKSDIAASKVLEGSIAILCDGTPIVLTIPKLFVENLHSPEDYYINSIFATFLRIIRIIAFFMSFTLPGIFIALVLFHQEMVPTELLISIAGQREGVPLSSPFEALLIILFFELLKESGLRLPEAIGTAVTLVGGLVIGTAAVDAGIISATMVIVIAATGMAEFVIPKLRESIAILRLIFLFLGSIAGLYGITCGLVFLFMHLVSLDSFGVPFMWPIAPFDKEGMKDSIVKFHISKLEFRPKPIAKRGAGKRVD